MNLFFLLPQKNKIQYKFSMCRSSEMEEGPLVRMTRYYKDFVVSHVNQILNA